MTDDDFYDDFDVDESRDGRAGMYYRWWRYDPADTMALEQAVEYTAARPYRPLRFATGAHAASVHIQRAGDHLDHASDVIWGLRKLDGTRPECPGLHGPLDLLPSGRAQLAGHLAALATCTRELMDSCALGPNLPQLAEAAGCLTSAAAELDRCRQAEHRDAGTEPMAEELLADLREPAPAQVDLPSPEDEPRRRAAVDLAAQAAPEMRLAVGEMRRGGRLHVEQMLEVSAQLYVVTRGLVGLTHQVGNIQVTLRRPGREQTYRRWTVVATALTLGVFAVAACNQSTQHLVEHSTQSLER